jgi:hypothetical protein
MWQQRVSKNNFGSIVGSRSQLPVLTGKIPSETTVAGREATRLGALPFCFLQGAFATRSEQPHYRS